MTSKRVFVSEQFTLQLLQSHILKKQHLSYDQFRLTNVNKQTKASMMQTTIYQIFFHKNILPLPA